MDFDYTMNIENLFKIYDFWLSYNRNLNYDILNLI